MRFDVCQAKDAGNVFPERTHSEDSVRKKEKPHAPLPVRQVFFINNTNYDLEDITMWTCDYLDIKDVTICVSFQAKDYKREGWVGRDKDIYYIYLKKDIIDVNIILVHELIHVKQYVTNNLILEPPSTVMYKGNKIDLKNTEYMIRPYEIEAHKNDGLILRDYYKYRKSLEKAKKE